tara:strand:+ start:220 stop:375 length:156 start_codon:yes stop_codon:yes gene_type:complete
VKYNPGDVIVSEFSDDKSSIVFFVHALKKSTKMAIIEMLSDFIFIELFYFL